MRKKILFDLINFTGILCSWDAFLPSNLFISLEIFGLTTNSKEKFKAFSIGSSILDKFDS